jgi:GR25 family glycosyltransferase involved in LPS biosynthesis
MTADADAIVINLERTPERLSEFARKNAAVIRWERFPAVEGASVDRQAAETCAIFDPELAYTKGAIGNALSHITLWRRAVDEQRALTICEDDAIFNRAFATTRDALLHTVDFDIVYWGWNFDWPIMVDMLPGVSPAAMTFSQDLMREATELFQTSRIRPSLLPLQRALGTVCYTISPRGAERLLSLCLPIKPSQTRFIVPDCDVDNTALDVAVAAHFPAIGAFACLPPLVITKNDKLASTVVKTRPNEANV